MANGKRATKDYSRVVSGDSGSDLSAPVLPVATSELRRAVGRPPGDWRTNKFTFSLNTEMTKELRDAALKCFHDGRSEQAAMESFVTECVESVLATRRMNASH